MKHLKYYMSMIAGLLAMLTACTNDMVENGLTYTDIDRHIYG